jgi:copper chaperone
MDTVTLNVKGMSCMGCVNSIKNVLEPIPGVQSVEVSLERGQATVIFAADRTDPGRFKAAIEDAGYEVV